VAILLLLKYNICSKVQVEISLRLLHFWWHYIVD
jgi:hypothetical protein